MGAIVNIRGGLSMQGLQPLFTADAIQHVMAQGMTDGKVGVFKVIGAVTVHADGLHDFLRRQVAVSREGDDFVQRHTVKPAAQSGPRRLAGITQPQCSRARRQPISMSG